MNRSELTERIAAGAQDLQPRLDANELDKMAQLLLELERWNKRSNLTAIRDPGDMIAGHILDSLSVRSLLLGPSIIDVGTGAGFPGLPLAIMEPGWRFTLLDSNGKKLSFVRHISGELGLGNVTVVNARAESYAAEQGFATVVARALTSLTGLVRVAGHLVAANGQLLALKGRYPTDELEGLVDSGWTSSVTALDVPGLAVGSRHAVRLIRDSLIRGKTVDEGEQIASG